MDNNINLNSTDLINSINFVKRSTQPDNFTPVTENSRTNEQEVYVAIIKSSLEKANPKAARRFNKQFADFVEKFKEKDSVNYLYMAAKNLLRKIREKGIISRETLLEIKQFALGKANLDNNVRSLAAVKENPEANETPVRAIKTVLKKFTENTAASLDDWRSVKQHFHELRLERQADRKN